MNRRQGLGSIVAFLLVIVLTTGLSAAEIHVMISGGLTGAYRAVAGEFEHQTGHRLTTVYGPVPNIRTIDGLKQALLAAKSIAYSDSASGVYVSSELFRLLGIEQVAAKARRIAGTPVAEVVAKGDAEIGFQQLSELLAVKGVTVVRPRAHRLPGVK